MSLRKLLREYVAGQIGQPGEHKKSELASAFLDEHDEEARQYMRDLAERQIAELIKELCDEPDEDPLPIFSGFPRAIAIAPGVVKATTNCTLDDLGTGLQYRQENVDNAQRRLRQYMQSMARFEILRENDAETVGECTERLRNQPPNGGGQP